MIGVVAGFEIRQRLRQLSTWIYFVVFLALGFLYMLAAGGAFDSARMAESGGKVMANAPYHLFGGISSASYFALLVVASLAAHAVHQDVEHGTLALLATTRVDRRAYLGGRFVAAIAVLTLIHAAIGLGAFAGTLSPFVDKALIGPNRLAGYVLPYLVIVLPNLVFMAALFFALAALLRSVRPVWVVAVVLLVGYLIAGVLAGEIEYKRLAALIDPFGSYAVNHLTEYWTPFERNTRLLPFEGLLVVNRVIWTGAGVALLALVGVRFRMGQAEVRGREKDRPGDAESPAPPTAPTPLSRPSSAALLARTTWLGFRETTKNLSFVVLVLAGVLFVILTAQFAGALYGTSTYPVTYQMIGMAAGGFGLFSLIITVVCAGELVWRERDAGMQQMWDALPLPAWLVPVSKLLTLCAVQVALMAVVMACGIGLQLWKGYTRLELPLYLSDLFGLRLLNATHMAVLALSVHAIVGHKYVGHFVLVLTYVLRAFLPQLGLEHNLARYGATPGYVYSDMNGYGHTLHAWAWFSLYWSACAIGLGVLTHLFWPRGQDTTWRQRFRRARARATGPTVAVAAVATCAFVGVGATIYWNTTVLNRFENRWAGEERQARYERHYKKLAGAPQPRVVAVDVHVDLRPETLSVRGTGTYLLENKTTEPISNVYVNLPDEAIVHELVLGDTRPSAVDKDLGFHTLTLAEPMAPGAQLPLRVDIEQKPRGFENGGVGAIAVANGSFLHLRGFLPTLGYLESAEIADDDRRRKHGFPPKARMPDLDDPKAPGRSYLTSDADWVTYKATVCTSPDQIAIMPGRAVREWTENGRRCFAFDAEKPLLHFFAVLSARYEVRRDRWNDVDIEIAYHRGHEWNVDRFVFGIKKTLDYCTRAFSPFHHPVIRIVEFPRYQSFAQSLAATIPYSEAIGFIARVDPIDEKDIDYPLFITAHEVAHQWWAHQVIGAHAQGSTVLSETLAEYTALMVLEHEHGAAMMRRFLRHELNSYLGGRAFERKKEVPLMRVENQPYIHYNKGGHVMYALKDAIGEEAVSRALAALVQRAGFRGPPYPTARELLEELRKVTPPDRAGLLTDLFETITLWDNRALHAKARKRPDGRYDVTIKLSARKMRASDLGEETDVPMDEMVDVGALDAKGRALHLEKQRIKTGETELTIVVGEKPAKAGVDPLNKLVDRKPDDNAVAVEDAGGAP